MDDDSSGFEITDIYLETTEVYVVYHVIQHDAANAEIDYDSTLKIATCRTLEEAQKERELQEKYRMVVGREFTVEERFISPDSDEEIYYAQKEIERGPLIPVRRKE